MTLVCRGLEGIKVREKTGHEGGTEERIKAEHS